VFQECTDLPTEGGRSCQDGNRLRSGGEPKDPNGRRMYMYREIPGVPNNGLENRKKKREVAWLRSTTTIGRERDRAGRLSGPEAGGYRIVWYTIIIIWSKLSVREGSLGPA
jgi:hypothetical protein